MKEIEEADESAYKKLFGFQCNKDVKVDFTKKRSCPRCEGIIMAKHFARKKSEIEVDECYSCGGIWLDGGELRKICDKINLI